MIKRSGKALHKLFSESVGALLFYISFKKKDVNT